MNDRRIRNCFSFQLVMNIGVLAGFLSDLAKPQLEKVNTMAHYLVTGGCGFIGSHLCDSLLDEGHRVRVIDDLSSGVRENLDPRAELIVGNICDPEIVVQAMADVEGCFHLAAIASVQRSVNEWAACHAVNQTGTIHVFDAARATDKRTTVPVVYASSAAVYGDNAMTPLSERSEPRPLTAYGADKLACEHHARVASIVHGVPTLGLRFFNVYGPRQDPQSPYSGVISIFSNRLREGRPLSVYGDGEQCRDFVFVGDVVRFLKAGMCQVSCHHDVFNVCTGRMISINQLIVALTHIIDRTPIIDGLPVRKGDIRLSVGDPSRAVRALHVTAEVSLCDGLQQTVLMMGPSVAAA